MKNQIDKYKTWKLHFSIYRGFNAGIWARHIDILVIHYFSKTFCQKYGLLTNVDAAWTISGLLNFIFICRLSQAKASSMCVAILGMDATLCAFLGNGKSFVLSSLFSGIAIFFDDYRYAHCRGCLWICPRLIWPGYNCATK